ncbi:MAG: exosortase A [Pseudomonadota bacterium]
MSDSTVARGWHWPAPISVLAVFLLFAALGLVFHADSMSVASRWWFDDNYSHGVLLVPLTAWLMITACSRLAPRSRPDALGLLGVVVVSAVMLVAAMAGIALVFQLLAPVLVLAAVIAIYGRQNLATLLFPVLFLYFSIPVWDAINPLLQSLTTQAVERMIFVTGLPALITGNFVTVSAGVFEIAEGCSGLRFFMISTAVGALYAHLYLADWRSGVLFVGFAMLLAIVGNWVRVYVIILVGIWLGIDHAFVTDHGFFGWSTFAVSMLVLFACARRFRHAQTRSVTVPPTSRSVHWLVMSSPLATLLAVAMAARAFGSYAAAGPLYELAETPTLVQDVRRDGVCGDWQIKMVGVQTVRRGLITNAGRQYCVDIGWYPNQRQGKELINTRNLLAASEQWTRLHQTGTSAAPPVRWQLVRADSGDDLLVAYQYRIGSRIAMSAREAKLTQLRNMLARRSDALVVAVAQQCDARCQQSLAAGNLPDRMRHVDLFEPGYALVKRAANTN